MIQIKRVWTLKRGEFKFSGDKENAEAMLTRGTNTSRKINPVNSAFIFEKIKVLTSSLQCTTAATDFRTRQLQKKNPGAHFSNRLPVIDDDTNNRLRCVATDALSNRHFQFRCYDNRYLIDKRKHA